MQGEMGMGMKYRDNCLKQVIFRLDFTREIDQSRKLSNSFYNEDIRKIFSLKQDLEGVLAEVSFTTEEGSNKISQSQRKQTSYRFTEDSKSKILVLEPSVLILSILKYIDEEELYKIINPVISQFKATYGNIIVKRMGLRYINNIIIPEGNAFDWSTLLDGKLTSGLEFPRDRNEISRLMSSMELKREDYAIRFVYGMFNSEYPNRIARKEFALDYDCYTREETELKDIDDKVKLFHDEIIKLFEESIGQGLREKMGVISE